MMRDVLLAEIPIVLRADLYAVAALVGASAVVIGAMLHLPSEASAVVAAVLCFGLRYMAIKHGWRLPIANAQVQPISKAKETAPSKDREKAT
jgi:uncharacterized membrane protein YeiH